MREHADVVDITGLLDLSRWTTDCPSMRIIVRRELPHPGATLDASEIRDGFRYQAFTARSPERSSTGPAPVGSGSALARLLRGIEAASGQICGVRTADG